MNSFYLSFWSEREFKMSDNTGLPFDPAEIETNDNRIVLFYKNETGNHAVKRSFTRSNGMVERVHEEWGYSYPTHSDPEGYWNRTVRHVEHHDLADDNQTLVGDGSNWDGAGQNWKEWLTKRHFELLNIRFRHDNIDETAPQSQNNNGQTELTQAAT